MLQLKRFGLNNTKFRETGLKRVQIVGRFPLKIGPSKVTVVETAVALIIRNVSLFFYLALSAGALNLASAFY